MSVADGVHQAADGAAFLRHLNEELARLAILEEADGDVTFVAGDLELVGQRHARVRHAMARRLIELAAQHGDLVVQLDDALLQFARDPVVADDLVLRLPPMSLVLRVFRGAERFEPSR